ANPSTKPARRRNSAGSLRRLQETGIFRTSLALVRRIDSAHAAVYNDCGIRRVDPTHRWRGGRVAEGGGLLNRYTVISRIVGSNPIPSATSRQNRQLYQQTSGL